MTIRILRTNSANDDFRKLVRSLDEYLAVIDGHDHSFYAQFNTLDDIKHVVVAYENQKPVGCGAMKHFGPRAMEIKRMYVPPEDRKKGIATAVLSALERWAAELSYTRCVLETGKRQTEAVALYRRNGYTVIPNFGQYVGVENSICFEKIISE